MSSDLDWLLDEFVCLARTNQEDRGVIDSQESTESDIRRAHKVVGVLRATREALINTRAVVLLLHDHHDEEASFPLTGLVARQRAIDQLKRDQLLPEDCT